MGNNMKRTLIAVWFAVFLISGCSPVENTAPQVEPQVFQAPSLASPLIEAAPAPPTSTPAPAPTPNHQLTITYLRARSYPASEIKIEQTLAPGSNYRRYLVSYLSDGLEIYALLTIPQGAKPKTGFPVIIFNHGYILPSAYKTTERYVAYVDAFARAGYIVIKPDYRGHGKSDGEATGGYGSPDYTIDVLNLVSVVRRHPDADPVRIGMWGHSMGGMVTLRAAVVSEEIKAEVIWSGVVGTYEDLLENWRHAPGFPTPVIPQRQRRWRQDLVDQYGTPEQNPAFWSSISPNSYVSDLSGPLQLHHSTTDPEVPIEFSEGLFDQVKAAGKRVELYTYKGDDHNLSKNLSLALRRSVAFFDKYVKDATP